MALHRKSLVIVIDLSVYGPLLCQSQTWKIENSSLPIMGLSFGFLSVAHSSLSTLLSLVAAVINEHPPFCCTVTLHCQTHIFDSPHKLRGKQTQRAPEASDLCGGNIANRSLVVQTPVSILLVASHSSDVTHIHASVQVKTPILKDCFQLPTEKKDGSQS